MKNSIRRLRWSSTTSSSEAKSEFLSVRPCGRDLFELIPRRSMLIDLQSASKVLTTVGFYVSEVSDMALTASGPHDVSIFPNGKMMVFPAKTNDQAERMGEKILAVLILERGCVMEARK